MSRLINLLNKNKMTLIVSLTRNDPDFAQTAIAAGAEALLLPVNVSGFGRFAEERENLSAIVKKAKVPVGIIPGEKEHLTPEEMEEAVKLGFDFFSMDIAYLPSYMLQLKKITKILALNSRYSLDKLMGLVSLGAEALEAAIIPTEGWGKELVVGDLQNYIALAISAGIPVIIPTQRSIKTSEVAIIADTGAKGLLLTSVVTGTTAKHLGKSVFEFRAAIDDLA